jgi:hypothetical protein
MECGCSIPNDKKSTNMVIPNGSSGKEVIVPSVPYSVTGKYV